MKGVRKEEEPFDRLTELCNLMVEHLREQEGIDDVKGIIFLSDAEKSGIEMFGYEEPAEGMADLLVHMKAIFASVGKHFGVMTDQGLLLMDPADLT